MKKIFTNHKPEAITLHNIEFNYLMVRYHHHHRNELDDEDSLVNN